MKPLVVYDIDDTIFFANQSIVVLDAEGNEIDHIDHEEYKRREDSGEHHHTYSWHMLENSEDFIKTLKPNTIVIEQLIKDLASDVEVILLTARTSPDNVSRFREAFSYHGMDLGDALLIFAGDNCPGNRSWLNKAIEFEKLFQRQPPHITIYDDSKKNLETFQAVSMDYPFTGTTLLWIRDDGNIQKYTG